MQVNRLNHLLFPPATSSVNAGLLDAADTDEQDASSGSATAAAASRAHRTAATVLESAPIPPSASEASVKLDLDHSQRSQAPVTYGPDGMFAGKSRMEVANTPAERFVATAVDIMRAYEHDHAQAVVPGTLDRLKQAVVSRFSAQA